MDAAYQEVHSHLWSSTQTSQMSTCAQVMEIVPWVCTNSERLEGWARVIMLARVFWWCHHWASDCPQNDEAVGVQNHSWVLSSFVGVWEALIPKATHSSGGRALRKWSIATCIHLVRLDLQVHLCQGNGPGSLLSTGDNHIQSLEEGHSMWAGLCRWAGESGFETFLAGSLLVELVFNVIIGVSLGNNN